MSQAGPPSKVPLDLARLLVDALEAKKADDIVLMDLTDVCSFADYFVVASGASERTLAALADDTVRPIKRTQTSRRPASMTPLPPPHTRMAPTSPSPRPTASANAASSAV